tara:strand:+ start:404 stop:739 length:336 start_codon:yes stop_codon:yes gene_type:complete
MKFKVFQNKGAKDVIEAFDAVIEGKVAAVFFLNNYKVVCEIEAVDLNEVFEIGNIGPEEKITRLDRMHSVSVGDVIQDDQNRLFVVSSFGFKRMSKITEYHTMQDQLGRVA